MKVLVITDTPVEPMDGFGDFNWGEVGEVATEFGFVCDVWNGRCGCGRSFSGMLSSKSATTVMVRETSLTDDDLFTVMRASLVRGGWINDSSPRDPETELWPLSIVDAMLDVADSYPVGTILSRKVHGTDNDDTAPEVEYIVRQVATPAEVC